VLGHVTAAKPRTKDSPDSFIAIRLDRFVLRNGQEVPVTIVVQALSGPLQSFFNSKSSTEELSTALPPIGTSTTRATTLGDPSLGQIREGNIRREARTRRKRCLHLFRDRVQPKFLFWIQLVKVRLDSKAFR
jgi:hypothetical protein